MIRETSFGSIEVLLEEDDMVICELLKFHREGRSHVHEKHWEICQILEGSGVIVDGDKRVEVKKGDQYNIAPGNPHWMIPDDYLEILIEYTNKV